MADGSSLAVSAAALQREESFRTALRNQKRRLSATERKPSVPDLGISKERAGLLVKRDSLTPPRKGLINQSSVENEEEVSSKQSTPDIRLEFWDIAELSPLSTPSATPAHSRSPSPFDLRPRSPSRSPSPRHLHSPLPQDSPLLSPRPMSPALKRAKSFNKEMRRCASFRAAREKSLSRNSSAVNSRNTSPEGHSASLTASQDVSFSIKRTLGARKGWKIMADDGHPIEGPALKTVVGMIKDMEYQGFSVPERITIKMP